MRTRSRYVVAILSVALVASQAAFSPAIVRAVDPEPIRYTYDPNGRLSAVIDPAVGSAAYGYDAAGNTTSITRRASTVVAVLEFAPRSGPVGSQVAISGTGFSQTAGQNTVKFNGVTAQVVSATKTQIVATVPATATTGTISVTSPSGTGASAVAFTVQGATAPTITGVSSGVAVPGASFTVTGTNFNTTPGLNKLRINNTLATVTTATATSLTATVPAGAGSGKVTVATANGQATSTNDLFIPMLGTTAAQVESTGRATFGSASTVTVTGSGKKALLAFDATAGDRITLSFGTGSLFGTVYLMDPTGFVRALDAWVTQTSAGWGATNFASGTFVDAVRLPMSGTYSLFLAPSNTGSIPVTVTKPPADFTASGTIGGPATTLTTTVPGQNASLTFSGTDGQKISVRATPGTYTGGLITIAIKKPDGSYLVDPFIIDNGGTYLDRMTLPATGEYILTFDPVSFATGSMDFTLYDVPADFAASGTIGGPATTLTTTVPGQNASLTFSGTDGQKISVRATPGTYTGGLITIAIKKPDGSYLVDPFIIDNGGTYLDRMTLPATGEYILTFDPVSFATGSMDFTFYDVPADFAASGTIGGPATTLTTTVPGQNASLTFSGTDGQKISVRATPGTYSGALITVAIKKPDGSYLVNPFIIDNGGTYLDRMTLPATGDYILTFDPVSFATGNMAITVYDVPADFAATGTIGGPATTLTISVPGQNATLTFPGTSGQQISGTLGAGTFSGSLINVSIKNPDGSFLVNPFAVGAGGGSIGTTNLTQTGSYVLLVDGVSAMTGSLPITINNAGGGSRDSDPGDALAARGSTRVVPARPIAAAPLPEVQVEPNVEPNEDDDSDIWVPGDAQIRGDWRSHRPSSAAERVRRLLADPGVTALSGLVLDLGGKPLSGITLHVGEVTTETDARGRFLLEDAPSGRHVLEIDGSTTDRKGRTYGLFEFSVTVAPGVTTVLPHVIWLPRIDTQHSVSISSPTTEDVVVTTPHIPGLELRIPAGTIIEGEDGEPVTEVSITPIPIDRTPYPLPDYVEIPVYFTIQPGGAYIERPKSARLVYPNYSDLEPGSRHPFWQYDPEDKGWYIYGYGSVTAEGRQVVPEAKTRLYEFTGAMFGGNDQDPADDGPKPGSDSEDGDPVDLGTGLFVLDKTDLILPGTMPVTVSRTYRPLDTKARPFGKGTNWNYGLFLSSTQPYQVADLNLPDGGQIHYVRTSPGNGYSDAVFESASSPTAFYKSKITWNGVGWTLRLRDGTEYIFHNEIAPLSRIQDRFGNSITLSRDTGTKNITQATSSDGRWVKFAYDTSNRVIAATDNTGRIVAYTYDAAGYLWKVTDPNGGVTTYGYDPSGRMTTIQDARQITFLTNEYYADGKIKKQTQADATTYQFSYTTDANGRVTQTDVTNPRGFVRRVSFDSFGFPLTDTAALGTSQSQTTTFVRDTSSHLPTSVTDGLDRRTDLGYDAAGNVTSVTRLAGTGDAVTTTTTYEPTFSLVASVTDPLDHTTTYDYDGLARLIGVTDPLDNVTEFTSNRAGQPLTITDATDKTATMEYSFGDLTTTTDPVGNQTRQFVDAAGRRSSVSDLLGGQVRTTFDVLNRPTTLTDALGGMTGFSYDANGNLLTLTDPRSGVTTYTYDAMDRVATRKDPLLRTESYVHDANGNLAKVTDRKTQVTTYQHDPLDRQTFVGFKTQGTTPNFTYESTVAYTYDAGDRVRTVVDSSSGTITLDYDGLDRLTSESTPQGAATYGFDDAGRRTGMTLAGQPEVTYAYDEADRLTGITQGSVTVGLTYDDAGRTLTNTLPNGIIGTYTYDDASRLTGISYARGGVAVGDLTYTYDPAGRRTTVGGSLARVSLPAAVGSTTYNAANQLTKWISNQIRPTYDNNGSMLTDGTLTYVWNARNQLIQLKSGSTVIASFSYDGLGRRIGKTLSGATTKFAADGANFVQEQNAAGTPTANLLTGGIDQTFLRTDATGGRTFLSDALGSTVALTDVNGIIQTSYTYEPYGKTSVVGQASANTQQFTGRENDGTLYQYRARYYNPTFGRFISEDPAGLAAGDANLYRYVGASPTNAIDPTGLFVPLIGTCLIGAGIDVLVGSIGDAMSGRKTTVSDIVTRAAMGCGSGLVGFGLGKALGAVASRLLSPAEQASTTLYRAVSHAEYTDIAASGVFRAGRNSLGGKFFAETAEHAAVWGSKLEPAGYRIVSAEVPRKVADSMQRWERLDGIGPARYGELDQLVNAVIRLVQ